MDMENEHLDTIPATESDEFIKSSVEILVPIPSEFTGSSVGKIGVIAMKSFCLLLLLAVFLVCVQSLSINPSHWMGIVLL
ncbi:hypothetical protein Tco_0062425 [Tanacetum coccineum]